MCMWMHDYTADFGDVSLPPPPLTCLAQHRRHAPRHEEDTADEAHLYEKHLPPLANFEYLGDDCLLGRARRLVRLHASHPDRPPATFFASLRAEETAAPLASSHGTEPGCGPHFNPVQMKSSEEDVFSLPDAEKISWDSTGQRHSGEKSRY